MSIAVANDVLAARAMMAALGIEAMQAHAYRSFGTGDQWRHVGFPAGPRAVASAVAGKYELSALALASTGFLVADLDVHDRDLEQGFGDGMSLDAALDATGRQRAAYRRQQIAEVVRPSVKRLQVSWPSAVVESSRRGVHVVLRSSMPLDASAVRAIAPRVQEVAGNAVACEIFPKARGDGTLDHCRLPISGPHARVLNVELDAPAYSRRAADVEALMGAEAIDFGVGEPPATTRVVASQHGETFACPENPEHLQGIAYVDHVLDLLENGIPRGLSWSATRRLAFAFHVAMGLDTATCVRAFGRFVELPLHRATHCASTAGRRELAHEFLACVRHQARGIEAGRLTSGRLRHPDLRYAIQNLVRRGAR